MGTAILKRPWRVANNGGWAESFLFWLGALGAPDALDGCSAQLNLVRPGRPASEALVFNSTDAAPCLVVSGNQVALDIPRAVTAAWTPGVYDVQLRVFDASADYDRYNLFGPGRLTVVEAPGS